MRIKLANPRGFCAGVERAIDIVHRALNLFGPPIYVRHEVVHNRTVVETLKAQGAIFVNELSDIPQNAIVIFSAHGVSRAVQEEATQRGLKVFNATCPLVTKVHIEVARCARSGYDCILIGHAHHPEVEGTMGQFDTSNGGQIYLIETIEQARQIVPQNPDRLFYVTQTTLSLDDTKAIIAVLRRRFPHLQGPRKDDICYATQNRQDAVKQLAQQCDLILVVGAHNSSNSNRLCELAVREGRLAYLINDHNDLQREWFSDGITIGITAGASAPESVVQEVIARLKTFGATSDEEITGIKENITFALPTELRP